MDFLTLFNAVAVVANPALESKRLPSDLGTPIADSDIDSLDAVMCSVYLCSLYGIPEEVGKHMPLSTVADVLSFVTAHKTQEPESLDAAMEAIK